MTKINGLPSSPRIITDSRSLGGAGDSMFGPQNEAEMDARMSETVTLTRMQMADTISEGIMEISAEMREQFNSMEKTVKSLEAENLQLRRDKTALEHKLQTAEGGFSGG